MRKYFDLQLTGSCLESQPEASKCAGEVVPWSEYQGLKGGDFVVDCTMDSAEEQY